MEDRGKGSPRTQDAGTRDTCSKECAQPPQPRLVDLPPLPCPANLIPLQPDQPPSKGYLWKQSCSLHLGLRFPSTLTGFNTPSPPLTALQLSGQLAHQHPKHTPTSGPLHLQFLCLEGIYMTLSPHFCFISCRGPCSEALSDHRSQTDRLSPMPLFLSQPSLRHL